MPATLSRLGYYPSLPASERAARFRTLSLADQIPWMAKYYMPYRGKLVNTAACYLATFTPAFLEHAQEPGFVIAAKAGVRGYIYNANAGFDVDRNLAIEVRELVLAVERACRGDRWTQVAKDLGVVHAGPGGELSLSRDRSIRSLQRLLGCEVDGLYGPETHAALVAFQRSAGLKPDGIAGPLTWAALERKAAG
jgi:peptidoglycan hydrolase-like protein with peptidoglycan-binding domain